MPEETSIVPETAPVAVPVTTTSPVPPVAVPPPAPTTGDAAVSADTTPPPAPAPAPAPAPEVAELPPAPERVDLHAFQKNSLAKLYDLGASLGLRVAGSRSKHQLVFEICSHWGRRGTIFECHGVLEVTREGYGFVRDPIYSFLPQPDDVYISPNIIRRFGLKTGNFITALARSPRDKESFLSVDTILTIEGIDVGNWQPAKPFESLTPLFPKDRIILENIKSKSVSTRVVDILAPLGKGQRALICAPPRGGKTILLKEFAVAIRKNHPEIELMVLLLDERPEEVTDFRETVDSVVYASTFDQMPDRHMQVAEIVIARAQRLVEQGRDVVVLLDSLTRLTRAYNNCGGGGGGGGGKARLTSGGVDPKALQRARKFFGAARNVEEGGSLTIVATALIETESRMDEVIFEEFKGTGNMELQLDREMVERRIFPAINMQRSGTRNDDRLYHPDEFRRVLGIRRQLAQLPAGEAMEVLVKNLRATQNNAEILLSGLRLS
jgi:transcription termination factor Rho